MTGREPGLPMRADVPVRDVALKWLDGMTVLAIAAEYDATFSMIQRRIVRARKEFPELPWAEREPANKTGPTMNYRRMNDGRKES